MKRQFIFDESNTQASEYVFPATVDATVQTLAQWAGRARIIAGGTDLMLEFEKKTIQPQCLISIEKIQGLHEIRIKDDYIEIGAAVTFADLKDHPYINQTIHVLADAARSVGSLAIQNVATLVGNIVNAMPAADGVIAAVVLEAEIQIADSGGVEWQPIESLFLGPGQSMIDPTRQIVTQIRFRRFDHFRGTAWYRLARRPSLTLPILNCAINVHVDESGQNIKRALIAVGPVAPKPFRAHTAEQFLEGRAITAENLDMAAKLVQQACSPRGNVLRASKDYRVAMIPIIVENTLQRAIQNAAR